MAYFVDVAVNENAAGGATSVLVTMPPHQTNDLIVVFPAVNGLTTITMGGWTQANTTQQSVGITSAIFYRLAANSTMGSTGTVTFGAADDYAIKTMIFRDVDTTSPLDNSTASASAAAVSWTSPTISTSGSNSLVIYAHGLDGTTPMAHADPGAHHILSSDSTGTTAASSAGGAVAWYVQQTAGTTPAPTWRFNQSAARTNHTFALRNKSGGRVPAYIDDSVANFANYIAAHFVLNTTSGTANNNIYYPTALTLNNIGPGGTGKAATYDAPALVADFGINPYTSAISTTPATTAAASVAGFEMGFAANVDYSTGIVMGSIIAANPKNANYDHGSVAQGGTFIVFGSQGTNTNYRAFQIVARDSKPNTEGRMVFAVQPSQSLTAFSSFGDFRVNQLQKILLVSNNPTATITLYTAEWYIIRVIVAAGGDANFPVDSDGLFNIAKSFRLPTITKVGASGLLSYVPIQIGGGDAINFQISAGALLFPRRFSETDKEINFHAETNYVGITYAGKSGDVIKHTNSVVTSPSVYYWRISDGATSDCTWDFTGLTVVNANVTLRPVTTFTSMTFNSANAINTQGSTLSSCTFSSCPEIVANSATFTECTISTSTGTSGALSITGSTQNALQTELDKITSCQFNDNATPSGALRLVYTGSAANITLSMSTNTFTTNNKDIRWEAPLLSNLTINLSGVANPSTSSTTNSNFVIYVNTKTLRITNIIEGTEIRLFTNPGLEALAGAETVGATPSGVENGTVDADPNNAGKYRFNYSYNYVSDTPIFVVALNLQYQYLRAETTLTIAADTSFQISQVVDRQYA